ncbi:restriction endonuclease subunit S [Aliarcobacter butzleri]|uniref:restriction endonuclease subunit S n=1 Tax=Aliarcobacter butzleri TaxID=28197 RepID=UPI0021B53A6D|nr:restriction endonuclease subunit S [Aliarcobacter butzleri]MCT7591739.1 restriction endonuclease subunit S [Aliarcobacter butzleri]
MIDNLPNGWKIEELNNCGKIITGKTPSKKIDEYWNSNDISFIKPDDFDKNRIIYFEKGKDFISQKGFEKAVKIPSNSVLTTCIGNIGNVLINKFEATINQQINAIIPNENINFKYLAYAIKKIKPILVDRANAPVVPIINKTDFGKFSIPIPLLQQQEKIVKVLDLTSNLIEKQKELLEKYDLFLKSKFIEMFGDPISNPMGWEVVKLGNYGTLARGKSAHRPRNAPFLYGGKYPFIQTGDITKKGSIYLRDFKQTYSEEGIKQSKLFSENTIAITIAANIGDAKVLSFDCYFPDSVVGFNVEIPLFVVYLLSFYKYKLEQESTQTAQKNINLQVLNNLDVIKPEIELQNKFASIVEKIETIKEKENQKLKQFEDLHNSMMNKAFKGEIK